MTKFLRSSIHFRVDHFYIVDFHTALAAQVSVRKSYGAHNKYVISKEAVQLQMQKMRHVPPLCAATATVGLLFFDSKTRVKAVPH